MNKLRERRSIKTETLQEDDKAKEEQQIAEELISEARNAAQKAFQKIEVDARQFQELLSELRKNRVDSKVISQLESTINDATQRNYLIAGLIEKGGDIGKQIITILEKFV